MQKSFVFFFITIFLSLHGQEKLKEIEKEWKNLFLESRDWFDYGFYKNALRGFKRLLVQDRNHANVNFFVAMSYYYLHYPASEIIPFLVKASKNVNPNYSYSWREKASPAFTWLYLGQMYMYTYQFDLAEKAFKQFSSYLTDKNRDAMYLYEINQWLTYLENAKKFYENPNKNVSVKPVTEINTPYNDYLPAVSMDDEIMVFSSDRKGSTGGMVYQDVYKSDLYLSTKKHGKWSKPKKMGQKLNTSLSEYAASLLFNQKGLIFSRDEKKEKNYDLYFCEAKGKKFYEPELFNPNINTKHNETSGFIFMNEKFLIFSSDRAGGYGGKDLYISEKLESGDWGPAYNLGPIINTPYDEDYPFVLQDGITLFFSSKGHNSMGGYDIFVSTLSDEGVWSVPENLGYPINTTCDDIGFKFIEPLNIGYYSTWKNAAQDACIEDMDIYEVTFK
ncbi:MAG: hypothetical protein N2Z72_06375 [Bacteroidales bacterium]|nr:hypothetical protein [Bacteroidales bacterium]